MKKVGGGLKYNSFFYQMYKEEMEGSLSIRRNLRCVPESSSEKASFSETGGHVHSRQHLSLISISLGFLQWTLEGLLSSCGQRVEQAYCPS